jgi:cation-transporting ATPase 13A1
MAALHDSATLRVVGEDADDLPLVQATFYVRRPLPLRLDVAPFALAYVASFGCYAIVPELESAAVIATPCLVLMHILTFLMTHWSVSVRCATQHSQCPPHTASLACAVAASGARAVCAVEREAATEAEPAVPGAPAAVPALFFVYHKSKYMVEPSDEHKAGTSLCPNVCRKLRMPSDRPLSFYTSTRGLQTTQAAREAHARFGDNEFSIPRPAFSELLQEHALAPFFVFQMLCVLLLCLDDYWCGPAHEKKVNGACCACLGSSA